MSFIPLSSRRGFTAVQVLLPIGILIFAVLAFLFLKELKPEPELKEPDLILPKVETFTVTEAPYLLKIKSQGTVEAKTESTLSAEVTGQIIWVAPEFDEGGFFKEGAPLLRIDPLDYKARLANAKASLASAKLVYAQEQAASAQAKADWQDLGTEEVPSPLVLREPQLEKAKADIESAEAALALAERDLERTEIRAPFEGRIREQMVDLGQVIQARNTPLARMYSIDEAQIRLPLTRDEIGFLGLWESEANLESAQALPEVTLTANYAGQNLQWKGTIRHLEGVVNNRSRMTYAVAAVKNPYESQPPLKVGLFVEASISGRQLDRAVRIPRAALHPDDIVYRLNGDNSLTAVNVTVVTINEAEAILSSGLTDGDRICLTPLLYFVEGMQVDPEDAP